MQRMIARRRGSFKANGGTDQIMFGISMPSGSVVTKVQSHVSLGALVPTTLADFRAYGVEGWVLPIVDPEAAVSFTTIWDNLVPKDTDVQAIDLDTGTADTTSFFEPGEADWSQLLQIGLRPRRVFQRLRLLSAWGPPNLGQVMLDTTFKWLPRDNFVINLARPIRVSRPSVLVFAIASPAMDDEGTTIESSLAENEWGQIKYIEQVIERAMMDLLGLTEAGATTPWEEATDLLQKHLEPDMVVDAAMLGATTTWHGVHDSRIHMRVKGTFEGMTLTTGR